MSKMYQSTSFSHKNIWGHISPHSSPEVSARHSDPGYITACFNPDSVWIAICICRWPHTTEPNGQWGQWVRQVESLGPGLPIKIFVWYRCQELRKIIKTVATQSHILRLHLHQVQSWLGFCPRPHPIVVIDGRAFCSLCRLPLWHPALLLDRTGDSTPKPLPWLALPHFQTRSAVYGVCSVTVLSLDSPAWSSNDIVVSWLVCMSAAKAASCSAGSLGSLVWLRWLDLLNIPRWALRMTFWISVFTTWAPIHKKS